MGSEAEKRGGFVDESTLRETIIQNIKTVMRITELNRSNFAKKTGIAPPTLTSYLNPNETKITPVTFLMNICMMEEVKDLGLEITVNDLLSSDFDPAVNTSSRPIRKPEHTDFMGVYSCYYFDQSKTVSEREINTSRDLRYGVLALFNDRNKLTSEITYEAYAVFFKPGEREEASAFKSEVDRCFEGDQDIYERNGAIRSCFRKQSGFYTGSVTFSDSHAFIALTCKVFRDSAMMVFYAPAKRSDNRYIGGLGAVCSVTHGNNHMPAAQKIIISRSELKCSNEVLSESLCMTSANIDLSKQAKRLSELCSQLYGSGDQLSFLDDSDKAAVITERMNRMVNDYIRNSLFSVVSVSLEDDNQVYHLIKKYS